MRVTKKKAQRAAKRYWPFAISAIVVLALLAAWSAAPASEWIEAIGKKVSELGWIAPFAYIALYVAGTIVLAPSPLMSIAAGVAFGWWGLPLAVIAATLGAVCSFLLGRYFFNDELDEWLAQKRLVRAAKHAVDEEGWRIQVLLRLSPLVPFGPLNYLMGLTRIPLTAYVWTTALGILPGSFVDIYIGVAGHQLATGQQAAYFIAGGVVTAVSAALITWKAKASLREAGVKA